MLVMEYMAHFVGSLSLTRVILPKLEPALKPEIDIIQKDIADGKVTEENFKETLDTTIKVSQHYLPDKYDPFLNQIIPVAVSGIAFEKELAKLIELYNAIPKS